MFFPADPADEGADKIADLVFQLFTAIARKTTWYKFDEHYLRPYLRLHLRDLREKEFGILLYLKYFESYLTLRPFHL